MNGFINIIMVELFMTANKLKKEIHLAFLELEGVLPTFTLHAKTEILLN